MTTYIVKSGDSISKIALNVLGDMSLWPRLAALNNIASPYMIYPGQVLQLPGSVYTTMPMGPAGASMPVQQAQPGMPALPAASSGGGLMQWIQNNKVMVGGGLALIAVVMLAMNHKKVRKVVRKRLKKG